MSARKLTLSRETLRDLEAPVLERVRGGTAAWAETQDCPTWGVVTTVLQPLTQKFGCELT